MSDLLWQVLGRCGAFATCRCDRVHFGRVVRCICGKAAGHRQPHVCERCESPWSTIGLDPS